MSPWWSYTLATVGVTGLWLAGSGKPAGWMVGVGAQILWLAYAVATHQWGFIVTAVAYAIAYTRGAVKARDQQQQQEVTTSGS
jgi:hypothetical protein